MNQGESTGQPLPLEAVGGGGGAAGMEGREAMSDRDLQEYQDLIRKHEDAYAAGLAAGRARADEAVALVAQLTRECDKERQRGDTYRARALALLKRAQYLRKERDANDGLQDVIGMICRQRDAARLQLVATEGVVVNTRQALENTASQLLDSGAQLAAERRAREAAEARAVGLMQLLSTARLFVAYANFEAGYPGGSVRKEELLPLIDAALSHPAGAAPAVGRSR